jgi:peroxiredoxin
MLKVISETLNRGDTAPELEVLTTDRTAVHLSDFRGKPFVLIFIRGTW